MIKNQKTKISWRWKKKYLETIIRVEKKRKLWDEKTWEPKYQQRIGRPKYQDQDTRKPGKVFWFSDLLTYKQRVYRKLTVNVQNGQISKHDRTFIPVPLSKLQSLKKFGKLLEYGSISTTLKITIYTKCIFLTFQ